MSETRHCGSLFLMISPGLMEPTENAKYTCIISMTQSVECFINVQPEKFVSRSNLCPSCILGNFYDNENAQVPSIPIHEYFILLPCLYKKGEKIGYRIVANSEPSKIADVDKVEIESEKERM